MATRKQHRSLGTAALAALLCLSLGACAGSPDDLGGAGSPADLGDEVSGSASALTFAAQEALPRALWLAAPAGCEGRLRVAAPLSVSLADGEPSLRVVLLRNDILCVDSASSVAEELVGRVLDVGNVAEHLEMIAEPGVYGTLSTQTALVLGDPSPQPSAPPETTNMETPPTGGEPSPQPSNHARPTAGDPSPQPSQPIYAAIKY